MSNVNEAKKNLQTIAQKLNDQQTYAGLSEEQRLKLFQDYLLNSARANEKYHKIEAENEKKVLNNITALEPALKNLAKSPYGPDTLWLLDADLPQKLIFRDTPLGIKKEQPDKEKEERRWFSQAQKIAVCGDKYIAGRLKFDQLVKEGKTGELLDIMENTYIRDGRAAYKRILDGSKHSDNERDNLTEEEKQLDDLKLAFENTVRRTLRANEKEIVVDGKKVEEPVVTPESEKFLKDFIGEYSRRHAKDIVEVQIKIKDKAEQLKTENIPEIELYKDNAKFRKKLADKIIHFQDPAGERIGARYQVHRLLSHTLDEARVDDKRIYMDGEEVQKYAPHILDYEIKCALRDNHILNPAGAKDLGEQLDLDTEVDGMMKAESDNVDNLFYVKHTPPKPGESYFYKIPEINKKISKMSNAEILMEEMSILEQQDRASKQARVCADEVKGDAAKLAGEMQRLNPVLKDTPEYREVQKAVTNFDRLGTDDFIVMKITDENNNVKYNKTNKVNRTTLNQARIYLNKAVEEYFKLADEREKSGEKRDRVTDDFMRKVQDFAWEKQAKIESIPIVSDQNLPLYRKVKEVRGIGDAEISERHRVNVHEDRFTKEIQKGMDEYNKAYKMHRCSSAYKKVGTEMYKFREKYNAMLQLEKEINDPKKPYEPGSSRRLLKMIKDVKLSAAKVRKVNADYIAHKKSDKEFGPRAAEYSQNRTKAVLKMDSSLQWFESLMDRKMEYAAKTAAVNGLLDAQRMRIVRALEKENDPMLRSVAIEATKALDSFCKMPNSQSQAPLTEKQMEKYRYDLAAVVLADYSRTDAGKRFLADCRTRYGSTAEGFRKAVKATAESDAFKKAVPKDQTKQSLTDILTDSSMIHDIRSAYMMNLNAEKRMAKEAAKGLVHGANNRGNQPVKAGEQPVNNNAQPKVKGPV